MGILEWIALAAAIAFFVYANAAAPLSPNKDD